MAAHPRPESLISPKAPTKSLISPKAPIKVYFCCPQEHPRKVDFAQGKHESVFPKAYTKGCFPPRQLHLPTHKAVSPKHRGRSIFPKAPTQVYFYFAQGTHGGSASLKAPTRSLFCKTVASKNATGYTAQKPHKSRSRAKLGRSEIAIVAGSNGLAVLV